MAAAAASAHSAKGICLFPWLQLYSGGHMLVPVMDLVSDMCEVQGVCLTFLSAFGLHPLTAAMQAAAGCSMGTALSHTSRSHLLTQKSHALPSVPS